MYTFKFHLIIFLNGLKEHKHSAITSVFIHLFKLSFAHVALEMSGCSVLTNDGLLPAKQPYTQTHCV